MSARRWIPAAFALALLAAPKALDADPSFSFGGGFATDRTFAAARDEVPVGWVGFGVPMEKHWSGFVRVSYARVTAPMDPEADLLASDESQRRVTYMPLSAGVRWSPGRALGTRTFAEVGTSFTWGNFEEDRIAFDPHGPLRYEVVQANHWMAGIALAAGFHHAIDGTVGIEWGLRFDQWAAPPRGWATSGIGSSALRRVALVAGLTLTPASPDLLDKSR